MNRWFTLWRWTCVQISFLFLVLSAQNCGIIPKPPVFWGPFSGNVPWFFSPPFGGFPHRLFGRYNLPRFIPTKFGYQLYIQYFQIPNKFLPENHHTRKPGHHWKPVFFAWLCFSRVNKRLKVFFGATSCVKLFCWQRNMSIYCFLSFWDDYNSAQNQTVRK